MGSMSVLFFKLYLTDFLIIIAGVLLSNIWDNDTSRMPAWLVIGLGMAILLFILGSFGLLLGAIWL